MLLFVAFLVVASYYLYTIHYYSVAAPSERLALTSSDLSLVTANFNSDELNLHERPLFWSSRSPVPEILPEPKVEVQQPVIAVNTDDPFKNFTLTGILAGDDFNGIFFRLSQQSGRLRVGEVLIGNWFLKEVGSTSVVFSKSNDLTDVSETRKFELQHVFPSSRATPFGRVSRSERQVITPTDDVEPIINNLTDQQPAGNDSDAG